MSNTVQTVAVDIARLSMGMKSIFAGCGMLFDALGVEGEALRQVSGLADTVTTGKPVREEPPTDAAARPSEDEPPFDIEEKPVEQPAVQIPVKDLQKVAAQKITTNRKNSAKIRQLLTTYGCGTMSEIPEGKREAFLNDLAQL